MFKTKFSKHAIVMSTAALALAASASTMAALVPNGDFESGGDSWALEFAGGAAFNFETTGGNGGGYMQMDNTAAAWGGVAISTDDPAGSVLADFGVTAGASTTFQWDMKSTDASGTSLLAGQGGIKIEYWNDAGFLSTSGDHFEDTDGTWRTFEYTEIADAGATRLKIVLLGIDNTSVYGYDNVGVVSEVPVPAAAWLFGSALLGLMGVARKKKV